MLLVNKSVISYAGTWTYLPVNMLKLVWCCPSTYEWRVMLTRVLLLVLTSKIPCWSIILVFDLLTFRCRLYSTFQGSVWCCWLTCQRSSLFDSYWHVLDIKDVFCGFTLVLFDLLSFTHACLWSSVSVSVSFRHTHARAHKHTHTRADTHIPATSQHIHLKLIFIKLKITK